MPSLLARQLAAVAVLSVASACLAQHPAVPMARPAIEQKIAPYAGHYNHAHQSPTFRWGWFGAEHFYPRVQWHRDYNGEVVRWSQQRRY